jgi:7-cyano-7-deazaguanine synthase
MDSATLAYYVASEFQPDELHGLSFNYGQRHVKELEYASRLKPLTSHKVVDLTSINSLLAGSSLTSPDVEVPDGHYSEETMKITVVPNRNMIMLSIAFGYAVSIKSKGGVFAAMHAGDHYIYPDCRPRYMTALNLAAVQGNEGFAEWGPEALHTPFINTTKAQIVSIGHALGVPYSETWSCYKGGKIHCGRCGTCVERKEAFRLAGVPDPTLYEDSGFLVEAYHGS